MCCVPQASLGALLHVLQVSSILYLERDPDVQAAFAKYGWNMGFNDKASHLQVPLGLLECPHDAKRAEQLPIWVRSYAWDDGVVGPLLGTQAVGVLTVQQKIVPSVVQCETASFRHDACRSQIC